MYAQSYQDEISRIIPDTYSGTALREGLNAENEADDMPDDVPVGKNQNPWEKECKVKEEREDKGFLGGIFQGLASSLGLNKGNGNFNIKFGTEELLIIGVATFLLFSKERDIECIIMLIALLLIT